MKEGFRKTIRNLQERNKQLEARVKELEQQLGQ
jgi:cell division septum initiation protein DivIVA